MLNWKNLGKQKLCKYKTNNRLNEQTQENKTSEKHTTCTNSLYTSSSHRHITDISCLNDHISVFTLLFDYDYDHEAINNPRQPDCLQIENTM